MTPEAVKERLKTRVVISGYLSFQGAWLEGTVVSGTQVAVFQKLGQK